MNSILGTECVKSYAFKSGNTFLSDEINHRISYYGFMDIAFMCDSDVDIIPAPSTIIYENWGIK